MNKKRPGFALIKYSSKYQQTCVCVASCASKSTFSSCMNYERFEGVSNMFSGNFEILEISNSPLLNFIHLLSQNKNNFILHFHDFQHTFINNTNINNFLTNNSINNCFSASFQCDQVGQYFGLWATFESLWQQLICPNLPHSSPFLGNFCKGVKIIYFSSETIFGQLLQTFGNFYLVTLPILPFGPKSSIILESVSRGES